VTDEVGYLYVVECVYWRLKYCSGREGEQLQLADFSCLEVSQLIPQGPTASDQSWSLAGRSRDGIWALAFLSWHSWSRGDTASRFAL